MGQTEDGARRFFTFARERHNIYLKRAAGRPRPWTSDPILHAHRFTNVFRELDRTTVWYRKNIREKIVEPELLLATVIFRWFNRIATGEALFLQQMMFDGAPAPRGLRRMTSFEHFTAHPDTAVLKQAITSFLGQGPYVTGAFIINTPTGMTKLDGVLWAIGQFVELSNWRHNAETMRESRCTLEGAWNWLRQAPRLGDFMSYELVSDLRWTRMLENAPDIMTWANPGPGAQRGLSYIHGGSRSHVPDIVKGRGSQIRLMQDLLQMSRNPRLWPAPSQNYPAWEMREVEHTLCEFAKYEMVRLGEGRTKGMYR